MEIEKETEWNSKKWRLRKGGVVLWHINYYWLFNAKYCFYLYTKYMIGKHIL